MKLTLLYDMYTLAVQNWCSSTTYNIHGLWPDRMNSTTYPKNCKGPDFQPFDENITNRLNKYWYDCNLSNTTYLHQHEWDTHGKCVYQQTNMSQIQYFEKALDLFEKTPGLTHNLCFNLQFQPIDCKSEMFL